VSCDIINVEVKYNYEYQKTKKASVYRMGDYFNFSGAFYDRVYIGPAIESPLVNMKNKLIIFIGALLIGLTLMSIILYSASKEATRTNQIDQEIQALKDEAEKIKKDNGDLQEKISYFETPDFQEKIAKEKLNMQKEGEGVTIIKTDPLKKSESQDIQQPIEKNDEPRLPVYKKWWQYFFGN
jgi:cell division protein FtsL